MCCVEAPSCLPRFRPGGREDGETAVAVVRKQSIGQAGDEGDLGCLLFSCPLAVHAMPVLREGLGGGLLAACALATHVRDVKGLIRDGAEALFRFRGQVEVGHLAPRWLLASAARAFASAGVWPRGHSRREGGLRPARKLNLVGSSVAAAFLATRIYRSGD